MPPRATPPVEAPPSNDMVLGEMRGQLREVVHTLNNLSSKFDALTREVIALGPLAADLQQLKTDVAALKEAQSKQSGVNATIIAVLHSPVILWVVMVAGIIWATVTGRFRP